jgi:hypothetical protein
LPRLTSLSNLICCDQIEEVLPSEGGPGRPGVFISGAKARDNRRRRTRG